MSQVYSRMLQPIVGSTVARMLRQTAPNVERAAWKRTFSSVPTSGVARYAIPRPTVKNTLSKSSKLSLRSTRRPFHRTSRLRDAKPPPKDTTAPEPQGLSARLKKLSREYGWSALGVYLGLTVLDFPFCFLLVRSVGTDRIGEC